MDSRSHTVPSVTPEGLGEMAELLFSQLEIRDEDTVAEISRLIGQFRSLLSNTHLYPEETRLNTYRELFSVWQLTRRCLSKSAKGLHEDASGITDTVRNETLSIRHTICQQAIQIIHRCKESELSQSWLQGGARRLLVERDIALQVVCLLDILDEEETLKDQYSLPWLKKYHLQLYETLRELVLDKRKKVCEWSRVYNMIPDPLQSKFSSFTDSSDDLPKELVENYEAYAVLARALPISIASRYFAWRKDPSKTFQQAQETKESRKIITHYIGEGESQGGISPQELEAFPAIVLEDPNLKKIVYHAVFVYSYRFLNADEEAGTSITHASYLSQLKRKVRAKLPSASHKAQNALYEECLNEWEEILNISCPSSLNKTIVDKKTGDVYPVPSLRQRAAMHFMQKKKKQLVAFFFGKGKTLAAFLAYEYLKETEGNQTQHLMIVPTEEVLYQHIGQLNTHYIDGKVPTVGAITAGMSKTDIQEALLCEYVFVTFSVLGSDGTSTTKESDLASVSAADTKENSMVVDLLANTNFSFVTVDEAQNAKKTGQQWTENVRKVVHGIHQLRAHLYPHHPQDNIFDPDTVVTPSSLSEDVLNLHLMLLTGDPVPNGPKDISAQFALAYPRTFLGKKALSLKEIIGLFSNPHSAAIYTSIDDFILCLDPLEHWESHLEQVELTGISERQKLLIRSVALRADLNASKRLSFMEYAFLKPHEVSSLHPDTEHVLADTLAAQIEEALNTHHSFLLAENIAAEGVLRTSSLFPDEETLVQQVMKRVGTPPPPTINSPEASADVDASTETIESTNVHRIHQLFGEGEMYNRDNGVKVELLTIHGKNSNKKITRPYVIDRVKYPHRAFTVSLFHLLKLICKEQYAAEQKLRKRLEGVPEDDRRWIEAFSRSEANNKQRADEYFKVLISQQRFSQLDVEDISSQLDRLIPFVANVEFSLDFFLKELLQDAAFEEVSGMLEGVDAQLEERQVTLAAWERSINEGLNLSSISRAAVTMPNFMMADLAQLVKRFAREGNTEALLYLMHLKGSLLEGILINAERKYRDGLALLNSRSSDRAIASLEANKNDPFYSWTDQFADGECVRIATSPIGEMLNGPRHVLNFLLGVLHTSSPSSQYFLYHEHGKKLAHLLAGFNGDDSFMPVEASYSANHARYVASLFDKLSADGYLDKEKKHRCASVGSQLNDLENTWGALTPTASVDCFSPNPYSLSEGEETGKHLRDNARYSYNQGYVSPSHELRLASSPADYSNSPKPQRVKADTYDAVLWSLEIQNYKPGMRVAAFAEVLRTAKIGAPVVVDIPDVGMDECEFELLKQQAQHMGCELLADYTGFVHSTGRLHEKQFRCYSIVAIKREHLVYTPRSKRLKEKPPLVNVQSFKMTHKTRKAGRKTQISGIASSSDDRRRAMFHSDFEIAPIKDSIASTSNLQYKGGEMKGFVRSVKLQEKEHGLVQRVREELQNRMQSFENSRVLSSAEIRRIADEVMLTLNNEYDILLHAYSSRKDKGKRTWRFIVAEFGAESYKIFPDADTQCDTEEEEDENEPTEADDEDVAELQENADDIVEELEEGEELL